MKPVSLFQKSDSSGNSPARQLEVDELESRILYSAAPVALVDSGTDEMATASPEIAAHTGFDSLDTFLESGADVDTSVADDLGLVTLTGLSNLTDLELLQLGFIDLPEAFEVNPQTSVAEYNWQVDAYRGSVYDSSVFHSDSRSFSTVITTDHVATRWDSFGAAPEVTVSEGSGAAEQFTTDNDGVDENTPHLLLQVNGEGRENLRVSYSVSGEGEVTPQYRIAGFGAFTNFPDQLIEQSSGDVTAKLPKDSFGQTQIEIRLLIGAEEVAIGDINILSD